MAAEDDGGENSDGADCSNAPAPDATAAEAQAAAEEEQDDHPLSPAPAEMEEERALPLPEAAAQDDAAPLPPQPEADPPADAALLSMPPLPPPPPSFSEQQYQPPEMEDPDELAHRKDSVKVVVRVRPLFARDAALGARSCVSVSPDGKSLRVAAPTGMQQQGGGGGSCYGGGLASPGSSRAGTPLASRSGAGAGGGVGGVGGGGGSSQPQPYDFTFHACLGPETTQRQVMERCGVAQLVDAALAGYHVTVLAYGQTGSGKTHTVTGGGAFGDEGGGGEGGVGGGRSGVGHSSSGNRYDNGGAGDDDDEAYDDFFLGGSGGSGGAGEEENASGGDSDSDDEGLMPRAIRQLYDSAASRSAQVRYSLRASYLEIYNESVYDLVHWRPREPGGLPVKWDPNCGGGGGGGGGGGAGSGGNGGAFYVKGLREVPCSDAAQMLAVLRAGARHRRVGAHELNMESSRSHAIFTVHAEGVALDPAADDCGLRRHGKISFVDLAGSERLKESRTEGKTAVREAIHINKSLSALGKVICVLAERDTAREAAAAMAAAGGGGGAAFDSAPPPPPPHVPYRDSKLTRLLQDSLGGSALTLMIACVSPSTLQADETLSTLGYARRASRVRAAPRPQYDPAEGRARALRCEVALLRRDNALLRERLAWALAAVAGGGGGGAGGGGAGQAAAATAALTRPSVLGGGGGLPSSPPPRLPPPPTNTAASSPSLARLAASSTTQQPPPPPAAAPPTLLVLQHRLDEAQALCAQYSELSGRLACDNDRLRAGRSALGAEHAAVLDEIDALRGKLGQLERAVLGKAARGGGGRRGGRVVGEEEAPAAAEEEERATPAPAAVAVATAPRPQQRQGGGPPSRSSRLGGPPRSGGSIVVSADDATLEALLG
jgi:hypothetical protein